MRAFLLRLICGSLCCVLPVGCRQAQPDPLPASPLLASSRPQERSLASRLVFVASREVGTLEEPLNSNRGARVDQYNLTCGRDMLGAPWCASFTRWCFWQVGVTNVPGAYSPDWFRKDRKVLSENVRPGDQGLIWFSSLGRYAHTIAAVESVRLRGSQPVEVIDIEGNSNEAGGREGIGVFRRTRSVDTVTFVRWAP